jgi:hypothetical protein
MEDMMTETYSELMRRQARVPCSCCGESTYLSSALVTTDDDDLVKWVLCKKCEGYCDRLENRAGQLDCPFDPCKKDAKYTRLWQKQYERWRKEMGDG